MKIAIMQPYFFPYVGYFELIKYVDVFVFLNDVQFTRKGWMNRNRIRSSSKQFEPIVVPVIKHNQKTNINEIKINKSNWNDLFLKKIICTYGIKEDKKEIYDYIKFIKKYEKLKDLLCDSIVWTSKRLDIKTDFFHSDNLSNKSGVEKIIDICNYFNCNHYVNACGGTELYSNEYFKSKNMVLEFMKPTQFTNKLSIIDVLFTSENEVKFWLSKF